LGPLAYCDSELTYGNFDPFGHFGEAFNGGSALVYVTIYYYYYYYYYYY
jgi:hypothetical protein